MVYAQAYHLFKNGFHYDITADEVKENEDYNRQFLINTSEKELVTKYLSNPASKKIINISGQQPMYCYIFQTLPKTG